MASLPKQRRDATAAIVTRISCKKRRSCRARSWSRLRLRAEAAWRTVSKAGDQTRVQSWSHSWDRYHRSRQKGRKAEEYSNSIQGRGFPCAAVYAVGGSDPQS